MAIDYDRLMARSFPEIVRSYDWRDSALYALGLGIGADPLDPAELSYVYEGQMQALPTMAVVLGLPEPWLSEPDSGIDFSKVVHGEQSLTIHAPLAPEGTIVARNSIDELVDKGSGRGAILRMRREIFDQASGALQSTQLMSVFCRADGGFGGPASSKPSPIVEIPGRAPDRWALRPTMSQTALIYRLSGDYNPLHADPAVARAAGFDRPIFHGLGTMGIACFMLLAACAGGKAANLRHLSCRFTAPFFPGETLRTEIWEVSQGFAFRCIAAEREVIVLDRGRAIFA